MPFNPSPTGYFIGIQNLSSGDTVGSSGVFIPYTSLESYNPSTTGDIRQLVYSFIERFNDVYVGLPTADRSSQLSINRSATIPSDNVIRNTYSVVVNLGYSGLMVNPE